MSNLLEQASLVMIPSGYKEDVVYSEIPLNGAGDLTFTRASDGTRINSQGLVEVVPWNLANDSNGFGGLSAITKTTGQPSPIDSTSGNLLTATGSGEHYSGTASLTAIAGNTYTYSVYAKFVQGVNLALRTVFSNGSADISTIWNLSTGALVLNAGDHQNPTITNVGNGWYRCSITYTPATVPAFPLLFRLQMAVGTNLSFTATTGDGFVAYGAQINNGALAPYFPTTDRLNVPRLTYQNGGGGCPSLLLEKQSTNLVTYSEQLDNADWTKANGSGGSAPIVTANYGISPDGTQNADRIQLARTTSGNSYSEVYQSKTVTSGQTYTFSVWLKSLSGTPTIGFASQGTNVTTYTATLTNDWVRYTYTATALTTSIFADLILWQTVGATSLTADFLAWGYQIEQSSYPTSYIPTTSSSATRVADECYKTGISSLIGQTEGTMFADFYWNGNAIENWLVSVHTSSTNFIAIFLLDDGRPYYYILNSGSPQMAYIGTALSIGRHKMAIGYKQNDSVAYMDGNLLNTDTSCTIPTTTDVGVGYFIDGAVRSALINEAALFKTRLTNAELASLTTI